MREQLTDEQNEAILKALNEAIDTGPWDKSAFLKVLGKNLNEIRDTFLSVLSTTTLAQQKAESSLAKQTATRLGMQEIYVSIYSSGGNDMSSWERIINNLPRQMISRPIYADEEQVKHAIRQKEHPEKEGYVAIFVSPDSLLQLAADKMPVDKFGQALLALKDRSLKVENISRFVHQKGVFKFERGHLLKS